MSGVHDYEAHEAPVDAILFDGCAVCEKRAADGLNGLCYLDHKNLPLLWNRMLNERMSGTGFPDAGGYQSNCERRLGEQLYLMGVLDQRGALGEQAFSPYRFGSFLA